MNLVRLQPKGGGGTDLKPFIVEFLATNNDFNGQEVVMHYLGTPHAGETVVDVSGTVINRKLTLYPLHDGIWSISSETINGKAFSKKITLEKWKEYDVTLEVGFDFNEWLRQGRVTETFSSLDEILADEKTIRQLMIVHNSVDYLVGTLAIDETTANIILDNDLCAKWINLSDYALDILYADENVKAVMDSVDKYGYGEWTLLPQVPKMTTNTAPSGEASAYGGGSGAYLAFDGNDSQGWNSENIRPNWIQYKFTEKKVINGIYFSLADGNTKRIKTWTLQASNDNFASDASTIDIASGTGNDNEKNITFNNSTAYQYYRLFNTVDSKNNTAILELQFYSWGAKGNVPIMTSNTAPYGVASASSTQGANEAYKAFSGYSWASALGAGTNAWLQYKFVNPTKIKLIHLTGWFDPGYDCDGVFKLQASNDGSSFKDITTNFTLPMKTTKPEGIDVIISEANQNYYFYYRLVCVTYNDTYNGGYAGLTDFKLYGRSLNVSVPKMDNYTTPFGEVIELGYVAGGYEGYRAFDNDLSTYWQSNTDYTGMICYNFEKEVLVKNMYSIMKTPNTGVSKLEGSNTGNSNDWHSIYSDNITAGYPNTKSVLINGNLTYKYYRATITRTDDVPQVTELQFYGLDYSEREFAEDSKVEYIYDHDIELMALTKTSSSALVTFDTTNCKTLRATLGKYATTSDKIQCGSANATLNGNPFSLGLDITNVNGNNATGFGNINVANMGDTSLWVENK